MEEHTLQTEFGTLHTAISRPATPSPSASAIFLLHGNSISSQIFNPLISHLSHLKSTHQIITFDNPGHGRSSNAPDPKKSYSQYSYAEAALLVLHHYQVRSVIIFGWSLGGHVALELITVLASSPTSDLYDVSGIMISGTPPVPRQQILGFRKDGANISALFNPAATHQELAATADAVVSTRPVPKWIVDDIIRTDRRAGQTMGMVFMEGKCSDQIKLIHEFQARWIAVVNGEEEPLVDLEYVDKVCKNAPRLWRGESLRLRGMGHAGFYDHPERFAKLLEEFVADCE